MTEFVALLVPLGLAGGIGWVLRAERQFGRVDGLVTSIEDVKTTLNRIDDKVDRLITSLLEQP